jgi:hypothetical protein
MGGVFDLLFSEGVSSKGVRFSLALPKSKKVKPNL